MAHIHFAAFSFDGPMQDDLNQSVFDMPYADRQVVHPWRIYAWRTVVALALLGMATGGFIIGRVTAPAPVSAPAGNAEAPPVAAAPQSSVIVAPTAASAPPPEPEAGMAGIALTPSTDPAILKLQKLAANGDLKAQYALAARYALGRGVPLNLQLAQQLLANAAGGGDPAAMVELANANLDGRFGSVDQRAASRWFEAAAATGSAPAALALGQLYENGIDGAPDLPMALGWYQRAAGYGSDSALAAIARLTPKNAPLTEPELRVMQAALKDHGFNPGAPTGKLDRRTQEAIKAYQAEIGLMQDGRPSRFLLEQLTGTPVEAPASATPAAPVEEAPKAAPATHKHKKR